MGKGEVGAPALPAHVSVSAHGPSYRCLCRHSLLQMWYPPPQFLCPHSEFQTRPHQVFSPLPGPLQQPPCYATLLSCLASWPPSSSLSLPGSCPHHNMLEWLPPQAVGGSLLLLLRSPALLPWPLGTTPGAETTPVPALSHHCPTHVAQLLPYQHILSPGRKSGSHTHRDDLVSLLRGSPN